MATRTLPAEPLDLSAIVIARNEEGNIEEVIEAVLRSLRRAEAEGCLRRYEVYLVDSASTDRTVDLASRYPIRIVRLHRDWPLSAAAGRASGARLARGRFLLFVDGDYMLDENWLPLALRTVERPGVAGVCGIDLEEVSGRTVLAERWAQPATDDATKEAELDSIATGLVRREAYDAVGGIHPYLRGAEDRDFGFRLRAAGWRIVRTREPMGLHRLSARGRPITYVDYYRSVAVWSVGEGQACRARWRDRRLRRQFLRRYATARFLIHDLQLILVASFLLLNLLGGLLGGVVLAVTLSADAALAFALDVWRRRHGWTWRETLYELHGAVYGPFRQVLFARGLLVRSPAPETYPREVEVVPGGTRSLAGEP